MDKIKKETGTISFFKTKIIGQYFRAELLLLSRTVKRKKYIF